MTKHIPDDDTDKVPSTYNDRKWLNPDNRPSTGTVVAYHGPSPWDPDDISTFFEVSDCHYKVRLHPTNLDSLADFAKKLRILENTAKQFADYLDAVVAQQSTMKIIRKRPKTR